MYVRLPLYAQYCSSSSSLTQRSINVGEGLSRWRVGRWFYESLGLASSAVPVFVRRAISTPLAWPLDGRPERVALEENRMRRRRRLP